MIVRLFLIVMPRNVLEQIQAQRFVIDAFRRTLQFGMPIPIVPPGIQTRFHDLQQLFFAVSDLFGREHAFRPVYGFGVVVEHDFHAVRMREIHKPFHIGKQLGVDIVPDSAVGRRTPIGVEHHIVERNIMRLVIQYELFRLFFRIRVIFTVPTAERGKTHKLALTREFNVELTQLLRIAPAQQQINIFHVFFDRIFALAVDGISSLGNDDTRRIRKRERFGRVPQSRQFSAVCKFFVCINFLAVLFQPHAFERLCIFGQIQFIFSETNYVAFPHMRNAARKRRSVRNKKRVFVAKFTVFCVFDANGIFV